MSDTLNESELISIVGERRAKALLLRELGLSYVKIGEQLNVTSTRARQLVINANLIMSNYNPDNETNGLSVRAKNCLISIGITTRAQFLEALKDKQTSTRILNYGKVTKCEVYKWANDIVDESK